MRAAFREKTERSGEALDNYLSLTANAGVIPYAEKGDVGNKAPEDMSKCKRVSPGDFVLNSMNFGIGSFGVSGYDGVCSSVYLVLQPNSEIFNPKYLERIFELSSFQSYAQSLGNGILAHRSAFGWDKLRNVPIPLPPRAEQDAIVDFLDRELLQIDNLRQKQAALISALFEKRASLVTELSISGTKGSQAFKDSGVTWLGTVPSNWEVAPLWKLFRRTKSTGHESLELLSLYREHGILPKASRDDNHNVASEDLSSYQLVCRGDLVVNKMKAWQGSIALSDFEGIVSPAYFVYKPLQKENSKYFGYLLRSRPYVAELNRLSKGVRVGQWDLDPNHFRKIKVLVPPLAEQDEIVATLDHELRRNTKLMEKAQAVIDHLQERREALISVAVTGKIDLQRGN